MSKVLFYDGECGFCAASVRWVAKRDHLGKIDFAPLQGVLAARHGLTEHAGADGTVALLDETDGRVSLRGEAVAELLCVLGGIWAMCGRVLVLLPAGLVDCGYRAVARHRHRFFANPDHCGLPDESLVARMRE